MGYDLSIVDRLNQVEKMERGKKMRKNSIIRLSIVLLAVVFLFGTFSASVLAQDEDKFGGVVRTPWEDVSLPRMDPHYADTVGSQSIAFAVAEPLLYFADNEYIPVLAESWEQSDNADVYTINVREGVSFQNGVTLTAEVIKQNFERITSESLIQASYLSNIKEMVVLDDYTLEIRLSSKSPYFMSGLQEIHIVEPSSWVDLGQDEAAIGTGPFMYDEDSYKAESGMTLTRYDDYWRGKPYLEAIEVIITGGRDASRIQLEKGELDVTGFVDFGVANKLEDQGMQVFPFGRINWARIVFNMQNVDLPLRKAINYAFSPEAVLNSPATFAGFGEIQNTIVYPAVPSHRDDLGYGYDPEKAKEILEEDGYVMNDDGMYEKDGEELVLAFPTREGMGWSQATEMIQSMLKQVGIGSQIEIQPSSTFYGNVREGEYDIAWWLSNSPPEPPIATVTFDEREHWSVTQKTIEDMQQVLEEAERTIDSDRKAELYSELQELHYEHAVEGLGIWMKQVHAVRPEVHNFKTTTLGHFYNFDKWWIE